MTAMKTKSRQKQLYKLKKQQSKKTGKIYPIILIIMIGLVHLLDTYATDVASKVQSFYVNDFFVKAQGVSFESGLQKATLISTISYIFMIVGPFYKALMDKVGRKPIFVINTAGMSIGMFICFIAPNFFVFAIGQLCIIFFAMHDMQMIYIYEVAPNKWRSSLYFICKFIGVFSTLAIPLLRDLYISEDGSGWRNVFLLPAVIGIVIFIMSMLCMRESPAFVKSRIEHLETINQAQKIAPSETDKQKSGIFPAVKYIFKTKQLKWLAISLIVCCTSMYAFISYYEAFMSTNYSVKQVNTALYLQPFAMAFMYLISGFIADTIGRKNASLLFSCVCISSFIGFISVGMMGLSPIALGILLGSFLGAFWNVTDLNGMMFVESTPTAIRGSVMGVQSILLGVGTAISLVMCVILLSFCKVGTMMLIVGTPGIIIGSIILMLKVKETKGTDLSEIEFEKEV